MTTETYRMLKGEQTIVASQGGTVCFGCARQVKAGDNYIRYEIGRYGDNRHGAIATLAFCVKCANGSKK